MTLQYLIVTAVLFLLSLLAAYVLFKVLESAAIIKRPGYQAGGAFAGFLLIFGSLTAAHLQLVALGADDLRDEVKILEKEILTLRNATEEQETDYWIVRGAVVRQDQEPHMNEGVSIGVIPHYTTRSEFNGSFSLRNIKIQRPEQYLRELQFVSAGYWPMSQILNQETATFNEEDKIITLKDPIELWPRESNGNGIDLASHEVEGSETELEGV